MKQHLYFIFLIGFGLLFQQKAALSQAPSIVINGDTTLADNSAKFPLWLSTVNTLAIG
ncbi:MAG: hypothetical protein IT223_08720 [Crocinitomicaceae bacterium]|nr:hypothetical protein [Crocinitomicaceae bacterium]